MTKGKPDVNIPTGRVTKDFTFDVKAVTDKGTIAGYASVFDVVDSDGDIIAPGAFARTIAAWKAKNRKIPVLWQHDAYNSIGVTASIEEDDRGLAVEAELLLEVQSAREAHVRAKAGAVGGLSIGFSVPAVAGDGNPSAFYDEDREARVFREVRLWEYSLVTFPANDEARISAVKADPAWAKELTAVVRELRGALDSRANTALLKELRDMMRAASVKPSDGGARGTRGTNVQPPDGGVPTGKLSGLAPSGGRQVAIDPAWAKVLRDARSLLTAHDAREGGRE